MESQVSFTALPASRKRKRTTTASKKVGKRRVYIPKPLKGILGKVAKAKLVYANRFTLTPGAGTVASHVFSANGCYDPDLTAVGGQPLGFDQLMALYDHYVVKTAKIEVWASNDLDTNAYGSILQISLRDSGATLIDLREHMEYDFATRTGIDHYAKNPVYLSYKCNPSNFLGHRDSADDPELKGTAGSNPTETATFHVSSYGISAAAPTAVNCIARITYDVELIEPKVPPLS